MNVGGSIYILKGNFSLKLEKVLDPPFKSKFVVTENIFGFPALLAIDPQDCGFFAVLNSSLSQEKHSCFGDTLPHGQLEEWWAHQG